MATVKHSIEINRPKDVVFQYIDDENNLKKWLGGLVKITPITEGGNRVGAKTKHLYNEGGRTFEMLEETLIYEPEKRVKIKGQIDAFKLTADYTLTETSGKTRIDYTAEMFFDKLFYRVIAPFIARTSKKKVVEDFNRLKTLIERETAQA